MTLTITGVPPTPSHRHAATEAAASPGGRAIAANGSDHARYHGITQETASIATNRTTAIAGRAHRRRQATRALATTAEPIATSRPTERIAGSAPWCPVA